MITENVHQGGSLSLECNFIFGIAGLVFVLNGLTFVLFLKADFKNKNSFHVSKLIQPLLLLTKLI